MTTPPTSTPAGAQRIATLYWDNIDMRLVKAQRDVFAHFGYIIEQFEHTGLDHGVFLDSYMAGLGEDDIALLMDIDCFPLNGEIVARAFAEARAGKIFGCAQSANHIDYSRIYVAPMFMAISRRTWDAIGRPSFVGNKEGDVAQQVNEVARTAGVEIEMLYPWASIVPKWRLGDVALYGLGAFYHGGVFHLFESRSTWFSYILFDVADAVLHDRPIDYMDLMKKAIRTRGDPKWARRFTRWRKMIWLRRLRARVGL